MNVYSTYLFCINRHQEGPRAFMSFHFSQHLSAWLHVFHCLLSVVHLVFFSSSLFCWNQTNSNITSALKLSYSSWKSCDSRVIRIFRQGWDPRLFYCAHLKDLNNQTVIKRKCLPGLVQRISESILYNNNNYQVAFKSNIIMY